jgi:hypothetical protein
MTNKEISEKANFMPGQRDCPRCFGSGKVDDMSTKDMTDYHCGIGVTIWALSIPFLTGILLTLVAFALVTR